MTNEIEMFGLEEDLKKLKRLDELIAEKEEKIKSIERSLEFFRKVRASTLERVESKRKAQAEANACLSAIEEVE